MPKNISSMDRLRRMIQDAKRKPLLSTGSTLLDLAISGFPHGAMTPGKYYLLVGDSNSGKTFLSMTCFAEAVRSHDFKNYRLIYDNIEDGMLMDVKRLFGSEVARRMESPHKDKKGKWESSDTIESFFFNVNDAIQEGRPFIYVLDSMDALISEASEDKFAQQKKAFDKRRAGGGSDKVAGSYGDGKAIKNSQLLRRLLKGLRETNSILLIISQTRDNIGSMFGGKTRSGGRSMRFYATAEMWSTQVKALKKDVRGKPREVGVRVQLSVKKNRISGRRRENIEFDIYPDYGIDNIGACVDYLVEEGYWPKAKQTIIAKGLGLKGTRDKLIRAIEHRELEDDLREMCGLCWDKIEDACKLNRKSRYGQSRTDAGPELAARRRRRGDGAGVRGAEDHAGGR